ncbi:MAG: hypothetical protein QM783_05885 [Phycisphaerales bacterium]
MYWFGKEEEGIPRTIDVLAPAPGDRYIDVLARLREADQMLVAGRRGEAFALLEWAWERGGDADPAFMLARVGLVLPRMLNVSSASVPMRERMTKIMDAETALYPWFDEDEEAGYLALCWAAGDRGRATERAAVENADVDEEAFQGLVGLRLARLKAGILELPPNAPASAKAWKDLVKIASAGLPRLADAEPKARWMRRRVELITIAGVGQYSMLLKSDKPEERSRAELVAADVLKLAKTAPAPVQAAAMRAMVYAAASADRADATHAVWLVDAATIDPPAEGKDKGLVDPLTRVLTRGTR